MNHIPEELYQKLLSFQLAVSDDCIVTGGHFMSGPNQSQALNEGTKASFELAIDVFSNLRSNNKKTGLGLLINNIGTTCGANVCTVGSESGEEFIFPEVYTQMLERSGIPYSELNIFWEKHLRNRSKKEFIKRIRRIGDLQEDEDGWWLRENEERKFLMTRYTPNDQYGTPACPLIMAAYAILQEQQGFKSSLNYWYIDADNFDNIPNHFMIEKGYDVAKIFGTTIKVMNVYFTRTKVMTNF